MDTCSPMLGEHINFKPAPTPIWPCQADPGQIEQVIMNLAVNARDAMAAQGNLTIETGHVTLDAEYCRTRSDTTPANSPPRLDRQRAE